MCCVAAAVCTSVRAQAGARRSITVATEPNAAVYIDSVRFGTAGPDGRLTIGSAPAGRRTIRVRADGFAEGVKPLLASQRGEIAIPLSKTTDEAWLAFQEGERQSALDRAKAAEAYRRSIKLAPKLVAAHIGLARVLSDGGSQEAALEAIRALRRIAPRNAEASAIEGRIHKELDDETRAIAAFKRSIAEGGGFQPEAYAGLGLLYKEKAESLGPDDPAAARAIADAVKNLAAAARQLTGAPDGIMIMQLLGLIYEDQKRFKEAIALYEEFLRIYPESSEAEAVRSFIVQINKQLAEQ